jgi:hypothetical protein
LRLPTRTDGRPARLDGRMPVIRVRLFADEAVLVAEVGDQDPE